MRQFLLNFLVGLFKKKLIRDKYLIHHEVNEGLTNPTTSTVQFQKACKAGMNDHRIITNN
jgi:hypothetical protein